MSDRIFIDTNIIIYAHTDLEPQKQKTSQQSISNNLTFVSTQVLQETANILVKKLNHNWPDVLNVLKEISTNNLLHINTEQTIREACNIAHKYKLSFYDSFIISSALECGCNIHFSEDLHHNQLIEGTLKITNPYR